MADDLEAMRERDRTARHAKVYGHSSSAKERNRYADHKPKPQSSQALRHRDEIVEEQARQHRESQGHHQRYQEARAKPLQTSHPLDGSLDRDYARESDEMHERHAHERSATQRRHLIERDRLRGGKSSVRQ
jgi:hypothetical protein